MPVSYKITGTASSVQGTAYYPDFDLNIDNLPEYGFGSQSDYFASGKYSTKTALMSMFELGFTFDMGNKNSLYTAMFLDSTIGTILNQEADKSYIGYNPTSVIDRKANGLYSTDKDTKLQPVAFGLTIGWNFK